MTGDTFYPGLSLHPLQTSRLKTVYRHNGRDWQDAESILFIHGSLASGRWWEPAMAALNRLLPGKYALYAPDLRSHGDAEGLPIQGMAGLAEDTLAVMDAIGIRQAHIVGWSFGGGPATLLALDHSERCLSLSLVSALGPAGLGDRPLPRNNLIMGEAIRRGDYETAARIIRGSNLREGRFPLDNSPTGNALFAYLLGSVMQARNYPGDDAGGEGVHAAMREFNEVERCARLALPVLILHGDRDVVITTEYFAAARAAFPSESSQKITLKGCSHSPMVEQPRLFANMLDKFMDGTHITREQVE